MRRPDCVRRGVRAKTESAIVPVIVGDERRAVAMSAELEKRGFVISAIRYPTVPRAKARLRVALMSSLARQDLADAACAIGELMASI